MTREEIKKWLSANPLAAMVLGRVTLALLAALAGLLAGLGLVGPEVAACLAPFGSRS